MIRIPKAFYDDHVYRDLPAPDIMRETTHHYYIADSPDLLEFLYDARHYSDYASWDPDERLYTMGLQSSARATVKAIESAIRQQEAQR